MFIAYNTSQNDNGDENITQSTNDGIPPIDDFMPSGDTLLDCMEDWIDYRATPIVFMGAGNWNNNHQQDNLSFKKLVASNPNNKNLPQLHIHIDPLYNDSSYLPQYLQDAKLVRKITDGTIYRKSHITAIVMEEYVNSLYEEHCIMRSFADSFKTRLHGSFWSRIEECFKKSTDKGGVVFVLNSAFEGTSVMPITVSLEDKFFHQFKQAIYSKRKSMNKNNDTLMFKSNELDAYYVFLALKKQPTLNIGSYKYLPVPSIKIKLTQYSSVDNDHTPLQFQLKDPYPSNGEFLQHFPEFGKICYDLKNYKRCVIIESNTENEEMIYYHLKDSRVERFDTIIDENGTVKNIHKLIVPCTRSIHNLRLSATNEVEVV